MTGSWKSASCLIMGKTMSLDYLLSSDLPWLLKRPHLTLVHWTQVSDRCPLGYLFLERMRFFLGGTRLFLEGTRFFSRRNENISRRNEIFFSKERDFFSNKREYFSNKREYFSKERSSDLRVAYPEVNVQVRDLVRVVGIVAPIAPRGFSIRENFVLSSPRG